MHRRNYYPKHIFSWVLLKPRTTDSPNNQPPTTYPPTSDPTTAESKIIFERLDNKTYSFCRIQTPLGKRIAILRYIIQKA